MFHVSLIYFSKHISHVFVKFNAKLYRLWQVREEQTVCRMYDTTQTPKYIFMYRSQIIFFLRSFV
jgi:starvation-inducible outer membrane lipoprotein